MSKVAESGSVNGRRQGLAPQRPPKVAEAQNRTGPTVSHHVLIALLLTAAMLVGFAAAAQQAEARPAAPASCTLHYKNYTATGLWDAAHAYSYTSDSGWYKSMWDWDSCNGGYYFKLAFSTDCKLHYWESRILPSGATSYTVQLGTRGNGCQATPGTLRFVTDGSVRTYSGAGTLLSNTGASNSSPYRAEFFMGLTATPYVEERTMYWLSSAGAYSTKWFGPKFYWQ
jgi:hypothetical protein